MVLVLSQAAKSPAQPLHARWLGDVVLIADHARFRVSHQNLMNRPERRFAKADPGYRGGPYITRCGHAPLTPQRSIHIPSKWMLCGW
ncbi:hypothetical protein SAMN05216330_1238 [Bradyrhizobium sp. Ghvi]|nr:hypothetical protein SAMN05216330_1238 [Bradyrhizobium sp. Ghvi]